MLVRIMSILSSHIRVTFILGLLLLPLAVHAQQPTVPVTVIVTFPGQASLNLGVGTPSTSAAARTSTLVFEQLTHPPIQTTSEQEAAAQEKAATSGLQLRRRPLTVGGYGRYERVRFDTPGAALDYSGSIYSLNAQLAWDLDDFSFGALIPYDFLDLNSLQAHRIGAIGFGQYHLALSSLATLHFTANGTYTHTANDRSDVENINTFGGGASVSLTLDQGRFASSATLSYQFNADDSSNANDHQHLLKLGGTAGVRVGRNVVVTLLGDWTADVTHYDATQQGIDKEYFDLGFELSWTLSSTWRLTGGYKKVLGLSHFDSDQVFLGTLFRF